MVSFHREFLDDDGIICGLLRDESKARLQITFKGVKRNLKKDGNYLTENCPHEVTVNDLTTGPGHTNPWEYKALEETSWVEGSDSIVISPGESIFLKNPTYFCTENHSMVIQFVCFGISRVGTLYTVGEIGCQ